MGDWPSVLMRPSTVVCPWSMESFGMAIAGFPSSAVLVQNTAYFFPFRLDVGATAVKMCVLTGATSNGNVDVGIYDDEWNYLISSGATAQGTASQLQELNITDTPLPPGVYWMAISLSSATGTVHMSSSSDEISNSSLPCYVMASAHPLPTTVVTPTKSTATSPIRGILMGVAFDTLI